MTSDETSLHNFAQATLHFCRCYEIQLTRGIARRPVKDCALFVRTVATKLNRLYKPNHFNKQICCTCVGKYESKNNAIQLTCNLNFCGDFFFEKGHEFHLHFERLH